MSTIADEPCTMHAWAQAVSEELPGWTYFDDRSTDRGYSNPYLVGPDRAALIVHRDHRTGRYTLNVTQTPTRETVRLPARIAYPAPITVDPTRPAAAVARDILRRAVPAAVQFAAMVAEHAAASSADADARDRVLAELVAAIPDARAHLPRHNPLEPDQAVQVSVANQWSLDLSVQPGGGIRLDVRGRTVTVAQAAAIVRALAATDDGR